jgi:hypothetical protein
MRTTVAFGFILIALNRGLSTLNNRAQRSKRTFIFFWRQVMQPVLLRVYFGLLRWVVSAALERGGGRSRGLPVTEDCEDE